MKSEDTGVVEYTDDEREAILKATHEMSSNMILT